MDREQAIAQVQKEVGDTFFVPCAEPERCDANACKRFLELMNQQEPHANSLIVQQVLPPLTFVPGGTVVPESILQEAHRLTHGPRRDDYGHPLDDYTRTAALASALLAHKLKEPLTADETALFMVCVKLSRQIHRPKRDNTVDGAGYFWVAQECRDEAERRAKS